MRFLLRAQHPALCSTMPGITLVRLVKCFLFDTQEIPGGLKMSPLEDWPSGTFPVALWLAFSEALVSLLNGIKRGTISIGESAPPMICCAGRLIVVNL